MTTYTPNYSARRFYWASQETIADFFPTANNTTGSLDLTTDGVLMCGKATRGTTLLWTTVDLWTATYIGAPFVYSTTRVGTNCGILAQNAACILDTGAYWMGNHGFFRYDGYVKPIDCDVQDYVFNSFNDTYKDFAWCLPNPRFGEVTWFYPSASATANNPCDRYVTYNYRDDHWTFGNMARTCGVVAQAGSTAGNPVLIGPDGSIYDHETGETWDAVEPFLESGPLEEGDGDYTLLLQRIVPDDKTQGDVTASIYTTLFPDLSETLHGPYTLSSPTSIRVKARQFRVRLVGAVASAWRVGVLRLGYIRSGRR